MDQSNLERIALEQLVALLCGRSGSIARLQGSPAHYIEEVEIFRDAAKAYGLLLDEKEIVELSQAPSDEGNEHQVWFLEDTQHFLKATWPGFYGLNVVHRADEEERASPIDYLERWLLHNQLFGDKIRFVGAVETADGLRMLIQQPAISGVPATTAEILEFFSGNGWLEFRSGDEIAFFDPTEDVAISDTHRGNLVRMADGLLAPIDLRVQRLSGSLLDAVKQLCRIRR